MTDDKLRAALGESVQLMMRWTTNHVTGFCAACREITERDGGRTPDVLRGEPHRRECPLGVVMSRAASLSAYAPSDV